jgi:hypothetical protein|tara:strand:- start:63 stop:275 length:213 start_codon:yes stop_codon:yes gene_type:complete
MLVAVVVEEELVAVQLLLELLLMVAVLVVLELRQLLLEQLILEAEAEVLLEDILAVQMDKVEMVAKVLSF